MKMTTKETLRLNEEKLRDYPGLNRFVMHLKRDWQLHLIILLPVLYMLIFSTESINTTTTFLAADLRVRVTGYAR